VIKRKTALKKRGRSDEEEKGMQIRIRMKEGNLKAHDSIGKIQ
jgi:hypothetical protein